MTTEKKKQLIAIIRVKGKPGMNVTVRKTFDLLRLYKKYHCVIIPNTKEYIGMLEKVKDASTWGEINEETLRLLLEKRGRLPKKKQLTEAYLKEKSKTDLKTFANDLFLFKKKLGDVPGLKSFFKLSPPRRGFERKGVKIPYSLGGVLGYRKESINDLLKRMI